MKLTNEAIGKAIRDLRLAKNWTQVDLGIHSGISQSHLSEMETGRIQISLRNAARLMEAMGAEITFGVRFKGQEDGNGPE